MNTVILVVAKAIQPLITFYLIITISLKIGLSGFGAYSTIFKYLPIFQIVAAFGLRNLLAREIAQNREMARTYIVSASYLALGCAIVSALIMGGVVHLLSDDPLVIYGTLLASVSLLAAGLADVYEGVLSGFEELKQVGYALLGENVFRVGVSVALIYSGYGIMTVVLVFVVGRFLKTVYLYYYLNRKFVTPVGAFDKRFAWKLFRQARTFALIMVCVTIYWNIDGIMLESMRSAEEVGYYSAAYRFLALTMVLVHSYVTSLFPVISNYFKSAKSNFEIACRKSLRLLVLSTVPIAISLSLLAEKIILLLFKETFLPSVQVLQVLIWALIPYAVSQVFAYALVAGQKQRIDLLVNASSMFLNIGLNLVLIPAHGFMGATLATLISICFYVVLQSPFVVNKLIKLQMKAMVSYGLRIVVAGVLMAAFILMLPNVNLFIMLPLAFLVYAAGAFGLGLITKNDRQMMLSLVKPSVT